MNFHVTDTHALIWHLEESAKLSPSAKSRFDDTDKGMGVILISAITLIEFVYLAEKGRIGTQILGSTLQN